VLKDCIRPRSSMTIIASGTVAESIPGELRAAASRRVARSRSPSQAIPTRAHEGQRAGGSAVNSGD
jgi:hypothetical protein